ncbi:sensor histidine kinase [Paenibacillus sp. GCM10028914]|uniref:cache domain-containing sensor histidine kinase n=1 Tax=Paenibacillus sp. GCM10028914 TaxID=3273416 RepID=UPI00360D2ACF
MRKQIFTVFFILCVLLVGIGVYWYKMSSLAIRNNTLSLSRQLMNQMSSRMDVYIREIGNLTLPMTARSISAEFLDHAAEGPYERLLYSRPITKMISNSMVGRSDIYGISVVTQDGIGASSYSNLFAQRRFAEMAGKFESAGKFQIMGRTRYNDLELLTLAVKFYSPGTQNWGILMVDLKFEQILAVVSSIQLENRGFVWIADPQGRYMYHPQYEKRGGPVPGSLLEKIIMGNEGGDIHPSDEGEILIAYAVSDLTGLTFVSETPLNEINSDLIKLRNTTMFFGVFGLILGLLSAWFVSFSLTDSILVLQRLMKRIEIGDLDVRAPEKRRGEIGYLYRQFNKMVLEIKNLIRTVSALQVREKELELKRLDSKMQALQYQINPHFLYNTLEIVNSYAIVENVPEISRVVNSLARIFRYSVENHAKIVPLSIEMSHIRDYLDIQIERFERLRISIEVDDTAAARVQAVPMMLQPLLENAFKHGYQQHKLDPGYFSIRGMEKGDFFVMEIEDHGFGMEQEVKDHYNLLFSGEHENNDIHERGVGLWNVHSRIRLYFGMDCGLYIVCSEPHKTIIQIILPMAAADRSNGKGEFIV